MQSGRSLSHVKELLIPASWENVDDLDPAMRAFYEYHALPHRAVGRARRHRGD